MFRSIVFREIAFKATFFLFLFVFVLFYSWVGVFSVPHARYREGMGSCAGCIFDGKFLSTAELRTTDVRETALHFVDCMAHNSCANNIFVTAASLVAS